MKFFFYFGALMIASGLSVLYLALKVPSLLFESVESKTRSGSPVFNEIQFRSGWKQDIWMMRQSQMGPHAPFEKWDRLAIVVDRTRSPKRALFYQLTSGEMNLPSIKETIPLKAKCFSCHSNGPRAIRMNLDSHEIRPMILDRLRAQVWNLRIKLYGLVESEEAVHFEEGALFRSPIGMLTQALDLKSCGHCHSQSGLRKSLTWEQLGTARFLVEQNQMPPFPFSIDREDKEKLLGKEKGDSLLNRL